MTYVVNSFHTCCISYGLNPSGFTQRHTIIVANKASLWKPALNWLVGPIKCDHVSPVFHWGWPVATFSMIYRLKHGLRIRFVIYKYQQDYARRKWYAVKTLYNMTIFLQHTHKRDSITGLSSWAMKCSLWMDIPFISRTLCLTLNVISLHYDEM